MEEQETSFSAEAFIDSLPMWAVKKNSVADVRRFLDRLGAPDRKLKIVHVAGTNGKGSVCKYLTEAFLDSGLHVGTFVSPHLVDVKERILLDKRMVSEADFAAAARRVKEAGETWEKEGGAFPAYFEFLFYMAVLIFADHAVDAVVLETGLGGRLDATNSCLPVLSVITSLSLDHMQYLGDTVAKIAAEKAGIIKPGVPVVYDRNSAEAEPVILAKAAEQHSAAYPADPCPGAGEASERMPLSAYDFLSVPYMRENARTAETAWRVLRTLPAFRRPAGESCPAAAADTFLESPEAFTASVRRTHWAGRMDEIFPDVFLDGGHNEDGVRAMTGAAAEILKARKKKPVLVTSAVSDKDLTHVVKMFGEGLKPLRVYTAALDSCRAADPERLAEGYRSLGIPVTVFRSVPEAWERAKYEKQPDEILFGAGSLYLVGEILAAEKLPGAERNRDDQL